MALNARLSLTPTLKSSLNKNKERAGMLETNLQVVRYLLKIYVADGGTARSDTALLRFIQPPMLPTQ